MTSVDITALSLGRLSRDDYSIFACETRCMHLITTLEKIHALGPKVEQFSLHLHYEILPECYSFLSECADKRERGPSHFFEEFLPRLLALRNKSQGKKYNLEHLVHRGRVTQYHAPYFKALIKYGAKADEDRQELIDHMCAL